MSVYCVGHGHCLCAALQYRFVGNAETLEVVKKDEQQVLSAEAQIGTSARDAIMPTSAESERKWQLQDTRN